jgi:hypothetical protein
VWSTWLNLFEQTGVHIDGLQAFAAKEGPSGTAHPCSMQQRRQARLTP